MKIIRNCDLKRLQKTKRFTCFRCGCIFEANAGEYRVEEGQREDTYIMNCPICHNRCFGCAER